MAYVYIYRVTIRYVVARKIKGTFSWKSRTLLQTMHEENTVTSNNYSLADPYYSSNFGRKLENYCLNNDMYELHS